MSFAQRVAIKYIRAKFGVLSALSKRRAAEKAFQLFCTPQRRNKKKLPPVFVQAERLHFSLAGNTIRGYRWNHPSEKKLLILHGFESSVINFDRYVKPLVKKGYEVLAFDAPAHGRSSGNKIHIPLYKDMIHHIDKTYGPVQSFLAHSLGGLAVSLFLEAIPHDRNYKLVLIAPATETKRAVDNFFRFLKLDKEVREVFDDLIVKMGGKSMDWYSVARAAGHIQAQVLFLQDKQDDLTPIADVKPIMDKHYPNFHFIISDGLGHRRIYRDQKSFKSIIDFL